LGSKSKVGFRWFAITIILEKSVSRGYGGYQKDKNFKGK